MELSTNSNDQNLSRENSVKTPRTPVPGSSGVGAIDQGITPREEADFQHEKKKLGHRRVDLETGEITYKKVPTSEIMGAIQLGITNAIGSIASKPTRDLLMQDFTDVNSVHFPRDGSNVSPPHMFGDFEFKTYAPIAFRYFRELSRIKSEDFLSSLSEPLRELSNSGASGSIFYKSDDDNYLIKTVQHKEAEFLQEILPGYFKCLNENPRTLLPKFFGLYCYQSLGKNVRVLVMNNSLPSDIHVHYKYDLKGATYGRRASKDERSKDSPTLQDLDFLEDNGEGVSLETPTYEALMKTIIRDSRLLESFKIMDYSLLLAIHNIDQESREKDGDGNTDESSDSGTTQEPMLKSSETTGQQRAVRRKTMFSAWESIQADAFPGDLDEEHSTGGIPARNNKGDRLLIFLGIIDILQSYQLLKKLEHAWKSLLHDGDTISVHRPDFYANRFQEFMKEHVFKKIKSPCEDSPTKCRLKRNSSFSIDEKLMQSAIIDQPRPMSARPDLVPTSSDSMHGFDVGGENRSSIRKLTFDTPRAVVIQRQDTYDENSVSREAKKVERLFAGTKRKSSVSATVEKSPRILNLETDGDVKDQPNPFEVNL